jgi:hypothetical protein
MKKVNNMQKYESILLNTSKNEKRKKRDGKKKIDVKPI